ncbi:MAG: transmembrane electron transporter [Zestosphaera sp.]
MLELPSLIFMLVYWALIDSVDPCIFALFVSILISASLMNIRHVVKIGSTFIISTFLGYLAFGALLRFLAGGLPRWLLGLATLSYGLVMLVNTLKSKETDTQLFVCREDNLPCRIINTLKLDKVSRAEVLPTATLGVIASFTLLPCSAGLYILFNIVMIEYGFLTWLLLSLLYVAVFETPLILILLFFVGFSRTKRVNEALMSKQKAIKVIGSLTMITVSIYILATNI